MSPKALRSVTIFAAATLSFGLAAGAAWAGGLQNELRPKISSAAAVKPATKTICTPIYQEQCANPYAAPPFDLCVQVHVRDECRQVPL